MALYLEAAGSPASVYLISYDPASLRKVAAALEEGAAILEAEHARSNVCRCGHALDTHGSGGRCEACGEDCACVKAVKARN